MWQVYDERISKGDFEWYQAFVDNFQNFGHISVEMKISVQHPTLIVEKKNDID